MEGIRAVEEVARSGGALSESWRGGARRELVTESGWSQYSHQEIKGYAFYSTTRVTMSDFLRMVRSENKGRLALLFALRALNEIRQVDFENLGQKSCVVK